MATTDAPLRVILPLTVALAPVALWPHRGRLGTWIIFVGLAANLAAIVANGGLMPIEQHTVEAAVGAEAASAYSPGAWIEGSKDVLLAPGEGRLIPLGDSILIRLGGAGIAASPGDIVVLAGLLALAAEVSIRWQMQARPSPRRSAARPGLERARAEGSATTPT